MKTRVIITPLGLSITVLIPSGVTYPFVMMFMEHLHSHSCSGVMDIAIARKGTCFDDSLMALQYVVGKEYKSEFMSYVKAKALEIHSTTDQVVMLDGEVFPGPSPFRFVIVPGLLTVYGEYLHVC